MTVRCFWLEETGTAQVGLRRYERTDGGCPAGDYHNAMVVLGEAPITKVANEHGGHWDKPEFAYPPPDDPRWPTACACGHEFGPDVPFQEWSQALYRRTDTGETLTLREAPPGAMWDAWWVPWKGPDGRCIEVVCPDGTPWQIDAVANNCTLRDAANRTIADYDPDPASGPEHHRCWIRTGDPPNVSVGKNGHTCEAGGGSIATAGYHGFLTDGIFSDG